MLKVSPIEVFLDTMAPMMTKLCDGLVVAYRSYISKPIGK